MHDARSDRIAHFRQMPIGVKEQRVDKCSVRVSRRRMHHHATRFIDHYDIFIFVTHIQRNILRLRQGFQFRRILRRHEHALAQNGIRFGRRAFHGHRARFA